MKSTTFSFVCCWVFVLFYFLETLMCVSLLFIFPLICPPLLTYWVLYIVLTNHFSVTCVAGISSNSLASLFTLSLVCFVEQKFLILTYSDLGGVSFTVRVFCTLFKQSLPPLRLQSCSSFYPTSIIVLAFTFIFAVHLELIFLYGVR